MNIHWPGLAVLWLLVSMFAHAVAAQELVTGPGHTGRVRFEPAETESCLPVQFRLASAEFDVTVLPDESSTVPVHCWNVTFPTPLPGTHVANNTVHAEFYAAEGQQPGPAAIVLHFLDQDLTGTRWVARQLAARGVHSLFLIMPYYGPRAGDARHLRMISSDTHATVTNVIQAVLDVRYAAAWLQSRPEVLPDRIGLLGISLGGIVGALAFEMEPRLDRACLVLAGGDGGERLWNRIGGGTQRKEWLAAGGTKQSFLSLIAGVDPAVHAHLASGRSVLMLNARYDLVIPRQCSEGLWSALGQPEIVWWPTGHTTSALYVFDALERARSFFVDGEMP